MCRQYWFLKVKYLLFRKGYLREPHCLEMKQQLIGRRGDAASAVTRACLRPSRTYLTGAQVQLRPALPWGSRDMGGVLPQSWKQRRKAERYPPWAGYVHFKGFGLNLIGGRDEQPRYSRWAGFDGSPIKWLHQHKCLPYGRLQGYGLHVSMLSLRNVMLAFLLI